MRAMRPAGDAAAMVKTARATDWNRWSRRKTMMKQSAAKTRRRRTRIRSQTEWQMRPRAPRSVSATAHVLAYAAVRHVPRAHHYDRRRRADGSSAVPVPGRQAAPPR